MTFEVKLGGMTGCVIEANPLRIVENVVEAREVILNYAIDALHHHAHDPERREYLRLNVGPDGPTWDDLAACEEGHRYDPNKPQDGMKCSYSLYRQRGIEGVGGSIWTYSVTVWATAPPEVWGHPADQPVSGMDMDEHFRNDLRSGSDNE